MKEEITSRIREFMELNSMSNRALALKIGVSPQTLNNQLRGRNDITLATIVAILETFEDINPAWLLLGRGTIAGSGSPDAGKRLYLDIIAKRDETIRNLEAEIVELKSKQLAI